MGRSRLAWAGSATAPWAIALGFLVSITAQAEQDPSAATQGVSRRSPVFSAGGPPPGLIAARYTVGSADELADIPDEIQPNAAFKAKHAPLPGINRQAKGDPFVPLRPGYEARAHAELVSASPRGEADWPAAGRSPAARPRAELRQPPARRHQDPRRLARRKVGARGGPRRRSRPYPARRHPCARRAGQAELREPDRP
jgi:hypothetical protein